MTYEPNLKSIWQHPTTGNHPERTKVIWGEVEKSIIITVRSLRLAQPGAWKIPTKQDTEGLINLLSSLVEFTKFPFFVKSHPLQKQLVEELTLYYQSSTLSIENPVPNDLGLVIRASTQVRKTQLALFCRSGFSPASLF